MLSGEPACENQPMESKENTGENCFSDSLRCFSSASTSTAFGLCAALTAVALGPEVNAQNAAANPAPPQSGSSTNEIGEVPKVTIVGEQSPGYKPEAISNPRIALPLLDTPQTINVVPRKVMEDQNATTLRDVLFNVPGI